MEAPAVGAVRRKRSGSASNRIAVRSVFFVTQTKFRHNCAKDVPLLGYSQKATPFVTIRGKNSHGPPPAAGSLRQRSQHLHCASPAAIAKLAASTAARITGATRLVIVMLRIVAGLLAAVLAVLLFCAEAQREAPCLRRDREDLARHVRSTTPSSLCWVPIRNALDVLESDGRLRVGFRMPAQRERSTRVKGPAFESLR